MVQSSEWIHPCSLHDSGNCFMPAISRHHTSMNMYSVCDRKLKEIRTTEHCYPQIPSQQHNIRTWNSSWSEIEKYKTYSWWGFVWVLMDTGLVLNTPKETRSRWVPPFVSLFLDYSSWASYLASQLGVSLRSLFSIMKSPLLLEPSLHCIGLQCLEMQL